MAASNEDRLTSLLNLVYDASTDSSAWPSLLMKLRRMTRSEVAVAYSKNPKRGGVDYLWVDGLSDEFFPQMPYFMPKDEWDHRRHLVPEARAVLGEYVISNRDLRRKEVYADFLRPAGMARLCCAMAINQPDRVELVSLFRRETDDEFGRDELQLMNALAPHLKRAFTIFHRFNHSSGLLAAEALDLLSFGAFLLDMRRKLLLMNSAGEALVRSGDGLLLLNNELRAALHADQTALETAVARAADPKDAQSRATLIAVRRPSGAHALWLWVLPLPRREAAFAVLPEPTVAVFATDPERPIDAPLGVIRTAFAMSRAEAELALALVNGTSLQDYAALREVAMPTVRTQLQSIFGKTHTRRQPELVRALMVALAAVRHHRG